MEISIVIPLFNESESLEELHDWILSSISSTEGIIFANGGDRNKNNIPELNAYKNNMRVSFVFGVGGTKKLNSSSKILNNFKYIKRK